MLHAFATASRPKRSETELSPPRLAIISSATFVWSLGFPISNRHNVVLLSSCTSTNGQAAGWDQKDPWYDFVSALLITKDKAGSSCARMLARGNMLNNPTAVWVCLLYTARVLAMRDLAAFAPIVSIATRFRWSKKTM